MKALWHGEFSRDQPNQCMMVNGVSDTEWGTNSLTNRIKRLSLIDIKDVNMQKWGNEMPLLIWIVKPHYLKALYTSDMEMPKLFLMQHDPLPLHCYNIQVAKLYDYIGTSHNGLSHLFKCTVWYAWTRIVVTLQKGGWGCVVTKDKSTCRDKHDNWLNNGCRSLYVLPSLWLSCVILMPLSSIVSWFLSRCRSVGTQFWWHTCNNNNRAHGPPKWNYMPCAKPNTWWYMAASVPILQLTLWDCHTSWTGIICM